MTNNLKKKFKVWEREDGIMAAVFFGHQEEDDARRFAEEMLKIMEAVGEKVKILIDASMAEHRATSRTRKVFAEFGKKVRAEKIAVFGLHPAHRVMAAFAMRVIGKKMKIKKVRFFKTEEPALKWLKEE